MSISYGTVATFESADTVGSLKMARLSDTVFVVLFQNYTATNTEAKVGTVSGTNITFGSIIEVSSLVDEEILAIAGLDATHVIMVATTSTSNSVCRIGTISGTSMTVGATHQFTTSNTTTLENSLTVLSATTAVLTYSISGSDVGTARVCTISGTSITYGAATTWSSGTTAPEGTVASLDATHVVVAFAEDSSYDAYLVAGLVSGTSITWGSRVKVRDVYPSTPYFTYVQTVPVVTAVSSTKCVVAWAVDEQISPDYYNEATEALVATISGTSITIGGATGSITTGDQSQAFDMHIAKMDATHVVIAWAAYYGNESGSLLGTISGDTLSWGTEANFVANATVSAWAMGLNLVDKFVVGFDNKCRVGTESTLTPAAGGGDTLSIHPNTRANTGASMHAGMQ